MKHVYIDALPGPTHNFAGLAFGNRASMAHKGQLSNPKACALQLLEKLKLCHKLGAVQLMMPPPKRPRLDHLEALGFTNLEEAYEKAPHLLAALCSSAIMWMANSATVTPSSDALDQRLHITPANCQSLLHRALEAEEKRLFFQDLVKNMPHALVHPPLLATNLLSDEGAANQIRLSELTLFVYGREGLSQPNRKYYPRQCLEASKAIARCHQLPEERTLFAQQNPELIDQGVFHNDLIAFGGGDLLVVHEKAFVHTHDLLNLAQQKMPRLKIIVVTESMLSIDEAIESYFFNSQLLTLPDQQQVLLLPEECRSLHLDWIKNIPHHFVALSESMQNGGGPACLRLELLLTDEELAQLNPQYLFTDKEYAKWVDYVQTHYPDHFSLEQLLSKSKVY